MRNLEGLQVGDIVFIERDFFWGKEKEKAVVNKITPTGMFSVKGDLYKITPTGMCALELGGKKRILFPTQKEIEEYDEEMYVNETIRKMNEYKAFLTYEKAKQINEILFKGIEEE